MFQLVSREGLPVDWDTDLARQELERTTTIKNNKTAADAAAGFEGSLRELEETWKRAHENVNPKP